MSVTGLEVFDKTVQSTNIWLNEIGEDLGPDKKRCYQALRAVLFMLRDRLAPTEAAHLAAQMPTLIRGIYYEGYRPADKPERIRSRDEFLAGVNAHLKNVRPIDSADAARAVFKVIQRHIAKGEVEEVKQALPQDIRELFPQ